MEALGRLYHDRRGTPSHRYYTAPDTSVEQALTFATGATPELAQRFIDADGHPLGYPSGERRTPMRG